MLDINWLKTFVTLAEYKHFGKAANVLHMTQPNVSLHLKQLEQATCVKLVERNPFHLTQAGMRLLVSSQKTLLELKICQADLNAFNDLNRGTLTIAASDIISRLLLIEPFQLFKAEFPGIDFTLLNTTSSQASELVKNAEADLGFVISQKQSQPLHFTELQQIKWCALGDGFVIDQQHKHNGTDPKYNGTDPKRNGTKKNVGTDLKNVGTDLKGQTQWQQSYEIKGHSRQVGGQTDELTLILLGHDTRTRDLIDEALPSLNLPNYRVMEVGSVDAQIDWAEAGFGVAIIPEFAVLTKPNLNAKVTALTDFPSTSLGYVVRQNQILSKAIKLLLNWVNDEIVHSQTK